MNIKFEETIHFIEQFYTYNPDMGFAIDSDKIIIEDRDPLLFINNNGIGFRFFDRTKYTTSNGKVIWSQPRNYSGIYYYGKRLNDEELLHIYNIMPHLKNIRSMILCEHGGLITEVNEQDITITEYINNISKQEKQIIKVFNKYKNIH